MKPLASLSLDLDNQWSYMKTHGDAGWEEFPSYFECLVPRVLEVLDRLELKITFFIVGQDACLPKNHASLRQIVAAGHEIGCHSFHHEPWLHRYTDAQLVQEFERAEESIEAATDQRPTGFRGPGFSITPAVLRLLHERGYLYDASTLPTYIGPLARAYYFFSTNLEAEEREERKELYGTWRHGLRPVKPYRWNLGDSSLLEIPVTTLPVAKIPFHVSYVLYLSTFSAALARHYFRNSLRLCRLARVEPSILLHPLDFLGGDDVDALAFFPAMKEAGTRKRDRVVEYLDDLRQRFQVLTMGDHARQISTRKDLPTRPLETAS